MQEVRFVQLNVRLTDGSVGVILPAFSQTFPFPRGGALPMTVTVTVGHSILNTIKYLDQNGNPMLVTPVPDSPPQWSSSPNPDGCDSVSVSADGLECDIIAIAPGVDTLTMAVIVGGATFQATQNISIQAAPQTLTSVEIESVVT